MAVLLGGVYICRGKKLGKFDVVIANLRHIAKTPFTICVSATHYYTESFVCERRTLTIAQICIICVTRHG